MALIAWYPLHKDLNDWSGNNQHLSNTGSTNDPLEGPITGSRTFVGAENYLTMPSETALQLVGGGHPFSISMWAKFADTGTRGLISITEVSSANKTLHIGKRAGDNIMFAFYGNDFNTTFIPALNTWYHYTFVWTGTEQQLWVNGEFNSLRTATGSLDISIIAQARIGYYTSSYPMVGNMCDVRLYNSVISAKEIKQLSQAKVSHYNFNVPNNNLFHNLTYIDPVSNVTILETAPNYIRYNKTSTSWTYGIYYSGINRPLTYPGKTYTFEYEIYHESDGDTSHRVDLNNTRADGGTNPNGNDNRSWSSNTVFTIAVRTWVKITVSWTVNNDYIYYDYTRLGAGDSIGIRRIKNLVMYEGLPVDNAFKGYYNVVSSSEGDLSGLNTDIVKWDNYASNQVVDGLYGPYGKRFSGDSGDGYRTLDNVVPTGFTTEHYTVSAWVRYSDYLASVRTDGSGSSNIVSYSNYFFRFRINDARTVQFWHMDESGVFDGITTADSVNDNELVHVVGVFDKGVKKIYINGVLSGSDSTSNGTACIAVATSPRIVGSFSQTAETFCGDMYDVREYYTSFSQDDVTSLYTVRASVTKTGGLHCSSLVANNINTWVKLFNHVPLAENKYFTSETIDYVGEDVNDSLYSRLGSLSKYYNSGRYTLKMVWPVENKYVIFEQPNDFSAPNQTKDGFVVLDTNLTQDAINLMTSVCLSGSSSAVYTAYDHLTNWYWPVGSTVAYSTGMPGPVPDFTSTSHLELYVGINSTIDSPTDDTTYNGNVKKTGVANFTEFNEALFTPSGVDYSTWILGDTSAVGWSINGSISENIIQTGINPWGDTDVMWTARNNDVESGADGGYNGVDVPLDPDVHHRFSQWIRREVTGVGTWYFGCDHSHTENLAGTVNTNPYFKSSSNVYNNEWFLVVAYLYKTGTVDTNTYTDHGVYNVEGTRIDTISANYRMKAGSTFNSLRSYLFYSTDPTTVQHFYRPRIDPMDGTEPTLTDLITGASHTPIISLYNKNGEFENNTARIRKNGTFNATDFSET